MHVIRSLDPTAGGPPVVCTRLAVTQAARGNRVAILSERGCEHALVSGVFVQSMPAISRTAVLLNWAARRRLADALRFADILHLHGVWDTLLLAVGAAARRADIPYVVVPHGMLDPWSLAQKWWKKQLALRLGARQLLNGAACLQFLNGDEAALAKPLGLTAAVAIVPNGVALTEIDPLPDPVEFRASHPALGKHRYVLFLSRLHYKKGLAILADAFTRVATRFTDVHLVVAGPDDGERGTLERWVQCQEVGNRVHVVGPLYGRLKWAALAGAAVFCLPSQQEGFSMAILEAMACRRPVVITRNCHFPEVADAGVGVVTPLDTEAVAKGLARVLADPVAAAAMGAAGRRLVEQRYTWERVADQCDRMYADAGIQRRAREGPATAH